MIALKRMSKHELGEIRFIPARLEAFVANPHFCRRFLAQKIKGNVAQDGQIFWRMADPDAGLIFPQGDIEHPVDTILNPPMRADRVGELLDLRVEARKVIARLDRHLSVQMPLRFYPPQRAQLGPGVLLREALRGHCCKGLWKCVSF